jgi:CheY-like chemotaxis protein
MSDSSILIVDDHREVRRLIRLALEGSQNGYRVLDVPSGEEAILISTRQQVDLLLADVRLAGMSGIELGHKMRARRPEMRVILISGIPRDEIQEEIDELNADGFYPKPLDLSKLAKDIHRLLGEQGRAPEPGKKPPAIEPPAAAASDLHADAEAPVDPRKALETLLQQCGAASLLLMNGHGRLVAQASSRGAREIPAAVQAQMETFVRFASSLGADSVQDFVRLWGGSFALYLIRRAELALVALFFDNGSDEQRLALSRRFTAAAENIWVLLEPKQAPGLMAQPVGAEVQPSQADLQPPERADEAHAAADVQLSAPKAEQGVDELADLFSNGEEINLDTGELNNFWETAAEDIGEIPTNGSAISYDQAINLGLAPED